MKDQDNETNVICYCKDHLPLQRLGSEEDTQIVNAGKQLKKADGEKDKLWSVFGELYWI
jgi:hypothetical protein